MAKNRNIPSLIEFWKIKRHHRGQPCIVKPFHRVIAKAYTQMLMGELPEGKDNLMILMPPRTGKTDLCDTAIEYGQSFFPDSESIKSGFGLELPVESVMGIRSTLSSDWYRSMVGSDWGCHVKMQGEKLPGRQDHFRTEEGGSVKAAGVGTGVVGFGAGKLRPEFGGAIYMDDLLKPQDMRSAVMRKGAAEYIQAGLKPRRNRQSKPYTPMLLVMQRLVPEDPAGILLREEREDWHIICIPALDPITQLSIWEERISTDELMKMADRDPEKFHGQYQQDPRSASGTILHRKDWRTWYDRMEVENRLTLKIITSDTAFKEGEHNDWSVFQCWGFEGRIGMYLIDQIKGRWEYPDLLVYGQAFIAKHIQNLRGITPATEFWIEDKASGQSLIQSFKRMGIPARAWEPKDKTPKDKYGRARLMSDPLSAGRMFVPVESTEQSLRYEDLPVEFQQRVARSQFVNLPNIKWVKGFKDEGEAFTADDSHMYDDQVDSATEATCIWIERGGATGELPVPFN